MLLQGKSLSLSATTATFVYASGLAAMACGTMVHTPTTIYPTINSQLIIFFILKQLPGDNQRKKFWCVEFIFTDRKNRVENRFMFLEEFQVN